MSKIITNIDTTTDTFQNLIDKTNLIANVISLYAITTDGTGSNTISGGSITTGNAYVNGVFSANVLAVNGTLRGGNVSSSALLNIDTGFVVNSATYICGSFLTSNGDASQVIDSYDLGSYRTAKYVLQISTTLGVQSSEILMTHNGSASFITEYAVITSNGVLGMFNGSANATSALLTFSPAVSNVNTINFQRTTLAL